MRVSAKVDYALRAALELAASGDGPTKGEQIAQAQDIPLKFLENILLELRHHGLVQSQRGAEGGYWLARPPGEIKLADVIRAARLQDVWIAMRANLRAVLDEVTLADVAAGELPAAVAEITSRPGAWESH